MGESVVGSYLLMAKMHADDPKSPNIQSFLESKDLQGRRKIIFKQLAGGN